MSKLKLSDLLNEFVARHDQYAWEIKDGVVNIFPKENYRDALFRDLLATQIDSFAVKKKTGCFELAKSLAATSEVRKVLAAYGTLKSTLNKVIKESPAARFWLVMRNSSDQTFFLSLGARFEDSPI